MSLGSKRASYSEGPETKILKMIGQLSTTTVNIFYTIVLANYSHTSYFFTFGSKFMCFENEKIGFGKNFGSLNFVHALTYLKN